MYMCACAGMSEGCCGGSVQEYDACVKICNMHCQFHDNSCHGDTPSTTKQRTCGLKSVALRNPSSRAFEMFCSTLPTTL